MEIYMNSFASIDRYDDGVTLDYAFMIRMWSALDRSIARFNRECGVIIPKRAAAKRGADRENKDRSK
ncbi:MAG TPA: hypothetical protein VL572_04400 [Pyrinomonadaceae bacterium]|nr:hypothetical protein [Pyrinomonadaceae bacterium]